MATILNTRTLKTHSNADALCRLLSQQMESVEDPVAIFHLSQFDVLPVTCEAVKRETSRDKILSQVYQSTMTGFNQDHDEILKPYYSRRNKLTTFQGCVMWSCRIVIPKKL